VSPQNEILLPKIPFGRIGLYLDQYRITMPSKSDYRLAINRFYEGIGSMPGTTQRIDTAGIVEQGPMVTQESLNAACVQAAPYGYDRRAAN
jgi:hypothetical protein